MKMFGRDGKEVDVPPEHVAEALRSGKYGLPKGSVNVVSPEGRVGSLDVSRVLHALDRGYQLESEEQRGERLYGERPVSAGLAGVARGASLGLSDMALTKSGLVDPKTLKGIQDHNEAASVLGEVTGAVGSAFIPGGEANLVSKVLKGMSAPSRFVTSIGANTANRAEASLLKYLTEKGAARELVRTGEAVFGPANLSIGKQALARAAAYAASGAVEGSLYGAGQAISEKALGHPETVGELLVAHMGAGAIAGGVAGGIFGGIGSFSENVVRRLQNTAEVKLNEVSSMMGEKAGELSSQARRATDTEAFSQVGLSEANLRQGAKRKGKSWEPKARYALSDEGVHPDGLPIYRRGQTSEETVERLKQAVEHNGERVGGFYESLDGALKRVDDALYEPVDLGAIGERRALGEAMARGKKSRASVRDAMKDFVEGEGPHSPEELLKYEAADLVGLAKDKKLRFDPAEFLPSGQDIADHIRNVVGKGLEDNPLAVGFRTDLERMAKNYEALGQFSSFKNLHRQKFYLGQSWEQGQQSRGAKSVLQDVERYIDRTLKDHALKFLSRFGSEDAVLEFNKANNAYSALKFVADKSKLPAVNDAGGAWLLRAAKSGIMSMAGSMLFGKGPVRAAVTGLGKGFMSGAEAALRPSAAVRGEELALKAARLRIVQDRLSAVSDRVSSFIERFVDKGPAKKLATGTTYLLSDLTGKRDSREAAKEFAIRLHKYAGNPEALSSSIAGSLMGLDGYAPELSAAMATKTAQVVTALQQFAPLPPNDSLLQPEAHDWQVGRFEAMQFNRMATAYLDPLSTVEQALSGRPDAKGIRIVKLAYPELMNLIGAQMLEGAATTKRKLTWRDKAILANLFDVPVDPLMSPEGVHRAQQLFAMGREANAATSRGSQTISKKNRSVNNTETATQRIERESV